MKPKEPKTQDAQKSAEKEQVQQTEETAEEPKQEEESHRRTGCGIAFGCDAADSPADQRRDSGVSPEEVLRRWMHLVFPRKFSAEYGALLSELTGTDQMAVLTDESLYTQVSDLAIQNSSRTIEELAVTWGSR